MLRLKTILMVGIVTVPFVINAADFSFYMRHRHGYWVEIQQENYDSAAWDATCSYNTASDENFHGGAFGAKVKGDNLEALMELGLSPGASASNLYTKWNFNDDSYLKIGYGGPDWGMKAGPQLYKRMINSGQGGGRRSISTASFLMEYGFKGLKLALAPNENQNSKVVLDKNFNKFVFDKDTLNINTEIRYSKTWIPKIILKYGIENDLIRWNIAGASNIHKLFYGKYTDTTETNTDTASMLIPAFVLASDFRLIVSKLTFQIAGMGGINGRFAGVAPMDYDQKTERAETRIVNLELKNAIMVGLPLSVSIAINDKASWTVGGGMTYEKEETDSTDVFSGLNVYTNIAIKPLPGLTFYPEVGFMQEKVVRGKRTRPDVDDIERQKNIYFGFATAISL